SWFGRSVSDSFGIDKGASVTWRWSRSTGCVIGRPLLPLMSSSAVRLRTAKLRFQGVVVGWLVAATMLIPSLFITSIGLKKSVWGGIALPCFEASLVPTCSVSWSTLGMTGPVPGFGRIVKVVVACVCSWVWSLPRVLITVIW